jgi:flagellar biosynthesis anti-sigma factor FlgM
MKISVTEVDRVFRSAGSILTKEQASEEVLAGEDRRDCNPAMKGKIAANTQDIQRVKQLLAEAPDIREDMVQALKERIESGTYHVRSEDIADLMFRRAFADRIR